ncbi:MAG: Hpt domain-containing protein, partial [Rhodoferax sp.]|nr:Hpt domain-containing protein [Rhodoferax sp.]
VLRSFCATKAHADLDIRRALEAGDHLEAQRIAHTVKGLAGQIAAHGLEHEAQALEHLLQEPGNAPEMLACIDSFGHALAWQIGVIEQALGAPVEPASLAPQGSLAEAQTVMRQLARLLAQDDAKAERLVADHAATLGAHFPQVVRELSQAVRAYDFERALGLVPGEFLSD